MKKVISVCKKCVLFSGIEEEKLMPLLACLRAKARAFEKGAIIFSEGEAVKHIGLVLSGTVRIERVDYFGNRSIVTNISAGDLFGESFACAGADSTVDAVANENADILLIDCRKIIYSCGNACEFHSRMIFNLLKIVASKNLLFNQKLEITSKRTTRDKLMTYLQMQAKQKGKSAFFIPFDRQALADYLEVDRSGLSAEISKLRKEGILECKKNFFQLL